MNIKEILSLLSQTDGVSGCEKNAAETALELVKKYTDRCYIDKSENVIAEFGTRTTDSRHIMIDAHIDQIGLIVTDITENGFIRFSNVGGVDRRLLPAQAVVIHGKKKIKGVVSAGTDHAMFQEFGTGIVGAGLTGEETYPGDTSGWVYDYKGQKWKGHKSNHFMYDAAKKMEEEMRK
jgi:putative aminopeptidase FrvX